jgi:hypothetical protein
MSKINDSRELRLFLVEQMEGVASGKVNTERAKSICNLSQQIYNSLNLEVKMAIARSKLKEGEDVKPVSFTE